MVCNNTEVLKLLQVQIFWDFGLFCSNIVRFASVAAASGTRCCGLDCFDPKIAGWVVS